MEALRAKRISNMRQQQMDRAENIAKGHGTYRLSTQDEFLDQVTTSKWVALHFFHKEFERCKIIDHHLQLIAPVHLECKFINIDSEKCPFFVQKLQVKTLPTLVIFCDGGEATQRGAKHEERSDEDVNVEIVILLPINIDY